MFNFTLRNRCPTFLYRAGIYVFFSFFLFFTFFLFSRNFSELDKGDIQVSKLIDKHKDVWRSTANFHMKAIYPSFCGHWKIQCLLYAGFFSLFFFNVSFSNLYLFNNQKNLSRSSYGVNPTWLGAELIFDAAVMGDYRYVWEDSSPWDYTNWWTGKCFLIIL